MDQQRRERRHHEAQHREADEGGQRPPREEQQRLDRQQVEQDLEDPRQAVFRGAELARVVAHADLGDPRAERDRHRRDEAVHVGIERHPLDDVGAVDLERAAVVADRQPGDAADQPVGEHRGQLARQPLVLPVHAPADDEVVALLQLGEHHRDVGRIVLQVAVHGDEEAAARELDPRGHRRGLAVVALEPQHPDAVVASDQVARARHRGVAAAVVHEQDLEGQAGGLERRDDRP